MTDIIDLIDKRDEKNIGEKIELIGRSFELNDSPFTIGFCASDEETFSTLYHLLAQRIKIKENEIYWHGLGRDKSPDKDVLKFIDDNPRIILQSPNDPSMILTRGYETCIDWLSVENWRRIGWDYSQGLSDLLPEDYRKKIGKKIFVFNHINKYGIDKISYERSVISTLNTKHGFRFQTFEL